MKQEEKNILLKGISIGIDLMSGATEKAKKTIQKVASPKKTTEDFDGIKYVKTGRKDSKGRTKYRRTAEYAKWLRENGNRLQVSNAKSIAAKKRWARIKAEQEREAEKEYPIEITRA